MRRWGVAGGAVALALVSVGIAVRAWGGRGFWAHPARLGLATGVVVFSVAASLSGLNLSSGRREDVGNRWIFLPGVALSAGLVWLVPYTDGRGLLTLDGDGVRYLGLGLFVAGGILRVWPMFVLGRRFSVLVAIQEQHQLVTGGVYRWIRHPSYLGGMVAMVGWILVFRSGLGALLLPAAAWILRARIDAEEALLAAEFGETYAAYRRRSWRLLPGVY